MAAKKTRKRKCKLCKKWFQPMRQLQNVCSLDCAKNQAKKDVVKELRKKKTDFLANNLPHQKKLAQKAVNRYIRLRDKDQPCISCQRHHNGQYHAGHYKSVGAQPALRYEPDNIHKQCSVCNNWKSANLANYRVNLINKIGLERVEWLEANHPPKKYTLSDIIEIKNQFNKKYRELLNEIEHTPNARANGKNKHT